MNGLVVWVGICGIIVTFFVGFLLPAYADSATYPIGIVADGYGTENETGSPYKIDVPYEINTNSIMGIARINSVQVDPPNSGASLQLNIVLHTITTTGKTDYWLQNVLRFPNTNYQTANFETNVWNMTDIKNNSKICPNLNPFEYILCKIGGPYIKFSNSFTYQLPFTESIFIYEQVIPQKGVKILLGYDGGGKGRIYASKTIPIPNIISASLLVTPNTKIQNYLSYDSELVWGGIGGGKMGDFSSMDSTLYLFYNDTSIQVIHDPSQPYVVNTWKPFPGYNTEGHDTEETAYNIYSTLSSNNNGTAFIKLGTLIQNVSPTPNATSTQIPSQTGQVTTIPSPNNPSIVICGDYPCVQNETYPSSTISNGILTQNTPQTVNPSYPSFLSITSTYMLDNNNVNYGIPNGRIVNMELQPGSKSISIETESTETSPLGIDLPESLIKFNADPQIFVDGIETGYSYKVKTQDGIALSIGIPSGDHKTEIIGSQVIPEFGSLDSMVFLIGFITTLAISSKIGSETT